MAKNEMKSTHLYKKYRPTPVGLFQYCVSKNPTLPKTHHKLHSPAKRQINKSVHKPQQIKQPLGGRYDQSATNVSVHIKSPKDAIIRSN